MTRAPIFHLLNSIADCFLDRWPGETLLDAFKDAMSVIAHWWTDKD